MLRMAIKWLIRWRGARLDERHIRGVSLSYCNTKREARTEFRRIYSGRVIVRIDAVV